jgi:hypothetical protein
MSFAILTGVAGVGLHANLELRQLSFKLVSSLGLPDVFSSFSSGITDRKNFLDVC